MFGLSQNDKNRALEKALEISPGSLAAVRRALERGADPKATFGSRALTPLHLATAIYPSAEAEQVITLLLSLGADVNKGDAYGLTPLEYAVTGKSYDIGVLGKLLEAGADCAPGRYQSSALVTAIDCGFWPGAEYLLGRKPELALIESNGQTTLSLALGKGAPPEFLKKLLAAKVDVNAGQGGGKALHVAVARARADDVGFLLACPGIDVNAADERGRTPLLSAVFRGDTESARALLGAGADADTPDKDGNCPLASAVRNGNEDLVDLLLGAGASPAAADSEGKTALLRAVERDSVPLVKALLDAENSRNAKKAPEDAAAAGNSQAGKSRLTPEDLTAALFAAVERGTPRLVDMLVTAGADVNAMDADGYTPLMCASRRERIEAMTLLLKAGAKLDETDLRGKTAYDIAVDQRNDEAKKFLARYRRGLEKKSAPAPATASEDGRYRRVAEDILEVQGGGLTTVFNFWTQQMIMYRGNDNAAPLVVQNFADLQRQEAVTEAYLKLKALGGNPPEPGTASLQKKAPGLGKG